VDPTGAVVAEDQKSVPVGGSLSPVQVSLGLAFRAVGIGDLDQMASHALEIGGVHRHRVLQQQRLTSGTDRRVAGQLANGVGGHLGLGAADSPEAQRLPRRRQVGEGAGEPHRSTPVAHPLPGDRGQIVARRSPLFMPCRVSGVELIDQRGLHGSQARLQPLQLTRSRNRD